MSTTWGNSRLINRAHELAERNGFKLIQDMRHHINKICLQVADDNDEKIWSKDMTLETFDDFEQANAFLSGYEKCQMYWNMCKGKKK